MLSKHPKASSIPLKYENIRSAIILAEWLYKELKMASGELLDHQGIMVPD